MPNVDVGTPISAWDNMNEFWELVKDLRGGTSAMRSAGTRWLPQESGETRKSYENRLRRSILYNGFSRALRTLVGKPFSKEVQIKDANPKIEEWLNDCDLQGTNINIFARRVFEAALADGHTFILVDYPKVDPEQIRTKADEKANNIRPYFVHIDARNVIGWRYEIRNGVPVLTQLRIREILEVPDGDYGESLIERVRVFLEDEWEVWERQSGKGDKKKDFVLVASGMNSLRKIPVVAVYTGFQCFMRSTPPLMDLAWLNVDHWQSASDQKHILHVARVPLLFGKGWEDTSTEGAKPIEIGPNRLITHPNPNADLKFVEHTGAAIGAGKADLEDIENRMAVLGAELLVQKAQATATATTVDSKATDSELMAMVRGCESSFDQALVMMAEWADLDVESAGEIIINSDFGISSRDSTDLQILLQSRQAGEITQETFLRELQRRGVLDGSLDVEDEMAAAAEDADKQLGKFKEQAKQLAIFGKENPDDAGESSNQPNVDLSGSEKGTGAIA